MTELNEDVFADTPESVGEETKWVKRETNTRTIRSNNAYKTAHDAYRKKCAARWQSDGTVGDPCIHDGEPIDYSLQYPHPLSWSLEHLIPVSERPELLLDVNNFASAHFACNSVNGDKGIESDIGTPTEAW